MPTRQAQPGPDSAEQRVHALLEVEGAKLLGYFTRRVDPRHQAADLVAETMLIIWQKADRLPPEADQARMWLYGVARNVLFTHHRRDHRTAALATRRRLELAQQDEHVALDGRPETPEPVERLRTLLADLPERDREIVTLVHWDGFTLAEVATLLGSPSATIRSRYLRLRKRLREQLEAND